MFYNDTTKLHGVSWGPGKCEISRGPKTKKTLENHYITLIPRSFDRLRKTRWLN